MKGGRDEGGEKIMGPMFPRLHVNDTTEKGGPRAPPRNKMAIYEQLSIPAQRFHSNTTTFPLPPHNTATLVPSESSSQGGGHVRSVFSPFYVPPAPAYSTEKGNSRYSDGMKINSGFSESERKSTKNASYKTSNSTGHLSSTAEFSSARPIEISKSNNSFGKKSGDEDDFRVPTFGNSGTGLSPKDQHGTNRERLIPFYPTYLDNSTITKANRPQKSADATCNSSAQLQNAHDKPMKRPNTTELKSRHSLHHIAENGKNSGEQKHKATVEIRDCVEKLPCCTAMGEKIAEPSKYAEKLLNQEHSRGPINGLENPNGESNRFYTECSVGLPAEDNSYGGRISVVPRHLNVAEVRENANILGARSEMSSRVSHGNSNEIPNRAENCCDESGEKVCRSLQRRDKDRNDDVSDTSMVDFISGQDISPDDVVEVIGQKHFWEARRAIVNQQRVFAVQVFELHRLIKVQKLIAGSPHLLLEDNTFFTPPSLKVSTKKLPSEFAMKSQPQSVKQQDESRKPTQNTNSSTENAIEKVPIPSYDNGVNNGLVSHISSSGPYPGNVPPTMMVADNKSSPWCFQPPGNQWLVPVMSPSEGLIYKPYHPTAGFMAPVYGACGPLNIPPVTGDFMNPAYCVPASHPQQGVGILSGTPALPHSYFTPYGLSAVNPMIPGTMNVAAPAAEQGNPSPGIQSNGQAEQFSMGEINYNMHPSRLCNMKSGALSYQVRQVQSSKDSEFQGSTVSSACEREPDGARQTSEGSDALPLFPLAPAMEALDQNLSQGEQPGRVIKVVPHNPRSATESAARIFRSIQEERQQFDS